MKTVKILLVILIVVEEILGFPHHNEDHGGRAININDCPNEETLADGTVCCTKYKTVNHVEKDEVKECWHEDVEVCYDTFVTEYVDSQEEECDEVFYKNCKIEFQEVPFEHKTTLCHTPVHEDCRGGYQPNAKKICKKWFESFCNTTYDENWKPSTWCSKKPKEICAPDNCKIVQGKPICHDKVLTSMSLKPVELCDLQPQKHCRTITKPVPHLKTVPSCRTQPEEICRTKLVNPHEVEKNVQLKWCKPPTPQTTPPPPAYVPASPPPPSYVPAPSPPAYTPPQSLGTYAPPPSPPAHAARPPLGSLPPTPYRKSQ